MPYSWIEPDTFEVSLPSGNVIKKAQLVDVMAIMMSADNQFVPNGLLIQVSDQISGKTPDVELTCTSGLKMPEKNEPVSQGNIRGTVVSSEGSLDRFKVRIAMVAGTNFALGEVRFGGMNMAVVESIGRWQWRPGNGDATLARVEMPQLGSFINLIVKSGCVEPQVVDEVTDPETQIPISKLTQMDKLAIFMRCSPKEVRPAATFPVQPTASVASAPDVQSVSSESSG